MFEDTPARGKSWDRVILAMQYTEAVEHLAAAKHAAVEAQDAVDLFRAELRNEIEDYGRVVATGK